MSLIPPSSSHSSSATNGLKQKTGVKETLNDDFFKNLDPKTLFSDQYIPTPLRQVDLQFLPPKSVTQEPGSGSEELTINQGKEIPTTESTVSKSKDATLVPANLHQTSLSDGKTSLTPPFPFEMMAAKERQFNKQSLIANGVKIALSGAAAVAGGALIAHGIPVGGVLVKQPAILAQFTIAMTQFSAMLIPAIASIASNEMIHNAIGGIIKSIKRLIPSFFKQVMFSGHGQESPSQSPAMQYLTSTLKNLEQFSTQVDSIQSPAARVDAAINLQKQLFADAKSYVDAVGTPEEKLQLQDTEQFLSQYESYVQELPSTAKVFADVPISCQQKLQSALYHALKSKNDPLVEWAQEYCANIGVPALSVSKIINSTNV